MYPAVEGYLPEWPLPFDDYPVSIFNGTDTLLHYLSGTNINAYSPDGTNATFPRVTELYAGGPGNFVYMLSATESYSAGSHCLLGREIFTEYGYPDITLTDFFSNTYTVHWHEDNPHAGDKSCTVTRQSLCVWTGTASSGEVILIRYDEGRFLWTVGMNGCPYLSHQVACAEGCGDGVRIFDKTGAQKEPNGNYPAYFSDIAVCSGGVAIISNISVT